MTATSHTTRQRMRLTWMESLGFIDNPSQASTAPQADLASASSSEPGPTQSTELVPMKQGRHARRAEPTGELVRDMWDSTDLHAPSLVDWAPQPFAASKLGTRKFRWPMLAFVLLIAASIAGFGYWIYRQPAIAATESLSQMRLEAEALSGSLQQAASLVPSLDADTLPNAHQDSAVYFAVSESARALFGASAELSGETAAAIKAEARETSEIAIDVSRQLMDATAYRAALEPALTLPYFETDPSLADLIAATEAFTVWRSAFESVQQALPSGVAAETSAELGRLTAGLESTQTAYLDALRTNQQSAAVEALGALRADLEGVRRLLLTDMGELSAEVSGLIAAAQAGIDRLLR